MNQEEWASTTRQYGGGPAARRGRDRMGAGPPPDTAQPHPPWNYETPQQRPKQRRPTDYSQYAPREGTQQWPFEPPRAAPSPPRNRAPRSQIPAPISSSRNGQSSIGVAISRPMAQAPQWPLIGGDAGPDLRSQQQSQQYQPPPGRGAPPQRPPRPSRVPSLLDSSRIQDHTPSFPYKPPQDQYQGRDPMRGQEAESTSPEIASPTTQSSRPSTTSSVGSIPDFPIPMNLSNVPRRIAGPPPVTRRGGSSFYAQSSYVSPIPEESPRMQGSHKSYASSAAIPASWGSGSPGYRYEDEEDARGFGGEAIEEGRESRESNLDDNEDRGLIRNASLGKRAKPSMITTRSTDKTEPLRPHATTQQKSKLERMGVVEPGAVGTASSAALMGDGSGGPAGAGGGMSMAPNLGDRQRETLWPMIGNPDSPLKFGTGFIDNSTSNSSNSVPTLGRMQSNESSDPRANAIMDAHLAASSIQTPGNSMSRTPSPRRKSVLRKPPRIDINAVRDAEARGSLTSLPDLIKRATKLAAMIDRGKRPASRLNELSDLSSEFDLPRDKEIDDVPETEKYQSGISGMLAAFPPPGLATSPTRDGTPRPLSTWPSARYTRRSTAMAQREPRKSKPRRCCGLPCWGFLLVLLILLMVIAAAVVVPLELIVFRKAKPVTSQSLLASCEDNTATACQNGGTSIVSTGTCACLCINSFTGTTCTVSGAVGCTTVNFSNSQQNVTVGQAIPRLISAAQTNFSVPLFSSIILGRFNSANLSCSSENALVTFDGESTRIGLALDEVTPTYETSLIRRAASSSSAIAPAATANGITFDPSSAYTQTSDTTPPSTTSSTVSSVNSAPTATFTVTEDVLDFARVAVLFILQQKELDAAIEAQSSLQGIFRAAVITNSAALNVSLGNSNSVNLLDFSVNLGNGNVGSASSSTTN